MRYTSSHPHAFRNRIARNLGVLVGAALVATLGLPSAAQAQTIKTITYEDDPGFTVTWVDDRDRTDMRTPTGWTVTFTDPDGTKVSVPSSISDSLTVMNFNENDIGTWWVQVGACFVALVGDPTMDTCPAGKLESGKAVGYTHGAPDEPENFVVSLVPGGVALTWVEIKNDLGIYGYQYSTDDFKTKKSISGGAMVVEVKPGDYTFMLQALGNSDNDTSTTSPIPGASASVEITVPMPTPTLPEIAALLLAMLLLGSGAYLLRRRQSGGLNHA